jgi:DAK2 domain fusion protein YloV
MTHYPASKTRCDGDDLRAMFAAAAELFQHNVDLLNRLNVFPVPDGDTGTNMYLTLVDTLSQDGESVNVPARDVAASMARGALWGAKGNSGVILSQFFKGLAVGLDDSEDFGPAEFAHALQLARDFAYKAVGQPREGTMLTVLRYTADAALEAGDSPDMAALLAPVSEAARRAVALTPTMLPVLRQAGVVDAGGHGVLVILEGLRMWAAGETPLEEELPPPDAIGVGEDAGTVSDEFLEAVEEEEFGYCTQLLVEGEGLDSDGVRERMNDMARSAVVIGDAAALKVHVHVEDPGPVISFAVSLGTLSQVKIESMDEQHREFYADRREQDAPAVSEAPAAIVAVARGDGIEAVFRSIGAAGILAGGDTMNPSVGQILEAVEAAPSDNVIFLPNNGNIVQAARQAAAISEKNMHVVPSTSIPQGVAALLEFNPHKPTDETAADMELGLSNVRTGEVCLAVRQVELNGVAVEEGQVIGILDRELVAAGDAPSDVLLALLERAEVEEGQLVTLYYGDPITEEEAEQAAAAVEDAIPGVEIETVDGGQPYYHYVVSIE